MGAFGSPSWGSVPWGGGISEAGDLAPSSGYVPPAAPSRSFFSLSPDTYMGNQLTKHPDERLSVSLDFQYRLSVYAVLVSAAIGGVTGDVIVTPGVLVGSVYPFVVAGGTDGTSTLIKVVAIATDAQRFVGLLTVKVSVLR